MPSITEQAVGWDAERNELRAVLSSQLFSRSPTLSHLLSYLCEKKFSGEDDHIKEYSIALEVFDRRENFDQDADSIVRVQANRLRKRLHEYYSSEGAGHPLRITVPVGQYVPVFENAGATRTTSAGSGSVEASGEQGWSPSPRLVWVVAASLFLLLVIAGFLAREKSTPGTVIHSSETAQPREVVGLPVGEEIRILAGASRKYVDHAGKIWSPDLYYSGGSAVPSTTQHIWRTQDPIVYRTSRQGDFAYNIPLKPGTYELRLHFSENFYGPENFGGGGGEGSRLLTVTANGRTLLHDFDVLADSGGDRTADVKVFPEISPAVDGQLHLAFSSAKGGSAMLSAIEILPGVKGKIRPVRIAARDVPYYSNDSLWWSPDVYFKGGQLSSSQEAAEGTDDPEFYETERWGHFSYAVPVAPGRYAVTLHFIDHGALGDGNAGQERVFNVFSNGKAIVPNLNIIEEVGANRPLVRKVRGVEPNAQGKLLLEFVPVTGYATVTAIEVLPE